MSCAIVRPMSKETRTGGDKASFGFEAVPAHEKQGMVNEVFARVAKRYDLMNDVMSGGLHRVWKDAMIGWLSPPRGTEAYQLLDVAGGTGDIADRFLASAGEQTSAIICDISGEMLTVGRDRLRKARRRSVAFVQGNAECLPVADASVDAYTIAFGIRNVTDLKAALAESYRVLKPGGRFLCLEFSEVQVPMLDSLYDRYSFDAIPMIGAAVAGAAQPYRYLVESIRRFPNQETFAAMIEDAGYAQVKFRNLSGGIAAMHSGWRI